MDIFAGIVLLFVIYLLLRPVIKGFKEGSAANSQQLKGASSITDSSDRIDPDHDNWEGAFWDVPSPRNIDANLRIDYRDGAGSVTKRDIRLMKYGPWEGGAIFKSSRPDQLNQVVSEY